ncbi:MAG TPA: hypothetical protein VMS56_10965 [Thermoanaerobaculia bacterium]|nr:hypothetical protein [Thermoanaerobaculia bacterium]
MGQEPRSLSWVTPAKYVGPLMLAIVFIGGAIGYFLVAEEKVAEAALVGFFTICFLLVGIADLLGELIILAGRRRPPSTADED